MNVKAQIGAPGPPPQALSQEVSMLGMLHSLSLLSLFVHGAK